MSRFGLLQLLALLLIAVPTFGAQGDSRERGLREAAKLVELGDRALRSANLEMAESRYRHALEMLPDLPEAHLGVGHVQMQRRKFRSAHESFLRAVAAYRGEADSLERLRIRRYSDAQGRASDLRRRSSILVHNIERLEALLSESSGRDASRQQQQLSALQSEVRQLEQEIDRLESLPAPAATTEDGVPGGVYFFLGNSLLHLERVEEAIAAWEICASRSPEEPVVYNNLAAGYLRLGRFTEARRALLQAESLGFRVNPALRAEILAIAPIDSGVSTGRASDSGDSGSPP